VGVGLDKKRSVSNYEIVVYVSSDWKIKTKQTLERFPAKTLNANFEGCADVFQKSEESLIRLFFCDLAFYQKKEEERAAYAAQKDRFAQRHEGIFKTEKADKHCPVFDEADISHTFDIKGAFSIRNGVRCLNDKVHKPLDVTSTLTRTQQGSLNRNTIVPGQFTAMSQKPLHTPHHL